MQIIKKTSFYIINFVFMFFPISIILGNFAINFNISLLILIGSIIFFFSKEKIILKINLIDKLILLFFFYTIIILIINYFLKDYNYLSHYKITLEKTFLFQRYLILYFVIRILIERNVLQIRWFNWICSFCVIFVSFDIFYQFFFNKDIFGIISPSDRHFSALFGDELIAGGYLQKFGFVTFLTLPSLISSNQKKKYIIIFLFITLTTSIILSGNRMPLILFLFGFLIYGYLIPNIKTYIIKSIILFLLIFSFFYISNDKVKTNFSNFYFHASNLVNLNIFFNTPKEFGKKPPKPYEGEFYCSKIIFKKNPLFGGGIRSYRTNDIGCNTHPHNYYIEVLVDLGIVGFFLILLIIFFISNKINYNKKNNILLPAEVIPYLIVLIIEFFPFRTSGSIFSTGNAVIIIIFLSMLIGLISKKDNLL